MIVLFAIAVFLVIAAVISIFALQKSKASVAVRAATPPILIIAAAILLVVSCWRTVPTGHTGIVTVFGKVEDTTYEAGVHFTLPWKEVVNMDNRNQKASVDLYCFSSDIQEVSVTYTINYQISKTNAQTIYKEIGVGYYDVIVFPRIQEAVKSEFAKYTAEQLLDKRSQLSSDIRAVLTEQLNAYNVVVIDASIENLDFSDAFTDAVEAKQVAEQKSKQAKIEQEQKNMEAAAAAERAEIEANAEAAVAKIAAQAELEVVQIQADAALYAGQKDAAVIEQVRQVLLKDKNEIDNDDIQHLLLYYYILQWNGELPETYFSSNDFYQMLAALGTGALTPDAGTSDVPSTDAPATDNPVTDTPTTGE
ncbi:MAG: prohibitin family protein [Clostridia bacterium]|nr:prohibitin family protein [Clostridia bacterium]